MTRITSVKSISRLTGIIVAALGIGYIIEFVRVDQMRTGPLVQAYVACLVSYLIPALWLRWRYSNTSEPPLAWLAIPTVGTILAGLTVIYIPNEIAVWNYSTEGTFMANALEALPRQLFNFFFFFLLFSAISCLIIGFAQVIGLGIAWTIQRFR